MWYDINVIGISTLSHKNGKLNTVMVHHHQNYWQEAQASASHHYCNIQGGPKVQLCCNNFVSCQPAIIFFWQMIIKVKTNKQKQIKIVIIINNNNNANVKLNL